MPLGRSAAGEGADGRQGEAVRTSVPDVGADRRRAYREYRAEQAHLHLSPRIGARHRPRIMTDHGERGLRQAQARHSQPISAVRIAATISDARPVRPALEIAGRRFGAARGRFRALGIGSAGRRPVFWSRCGPAQMPKDREAASANLDLALAD